MQILWATVIVTGVTGGFYALDAVERHRRIPQLRFLANLVGLCVSVVAVILGAWMFGRGLG